jgi:spore coat polysaccharide biosynthesis protein SpsF
MANTIAILQARSQSRRSPDHLLQPVAGEPLLQRTIERVLLCLRIDRVVVATSTEAGDDPLEAIARRMNVDCFRGSSDDVLDRYYRAATAFGAEHIVRLTADCVLTDPLLIDEIITRCYSGLHEYCSNVTVPSFPLGLNAEVFSFAALAAAWRESDAACDRKDATAYLRRNPVRFVHGIVRDACDRSHMRWIAQEPEDMEFVNRVYDRLYPFGINFTREDVYELLEECPELAAINAHCGTPASRSRQWQAA